MAVVLRGLGLDSDVIGPLATAGLGIQVVTPVPPEEQQQKHSGGNADRSWLRYMLLAELNTYKDTSRIDIGDILLASEVRIVRPVVKKDNSKEILTTLDIKITKILAKQALLDEYDGLDEKEKFKQALLAELEEE